LSEGARLLAEVHALLAAATVGPFAGTKEAEILTQAAARLDEPLRVAVAGKVKAGKSTLLNALVEIGRAHV
jgi:predicted GTPase